MEPLKDPSKGQVDFDGKDVLDMYEVFLSDCTMAALFQRENELRQRLFSASDGISELVAANQKVKNLATCLQQNAHCLLFRQKFLSSINERLDEVRSDLKDVLPAAT